MKPSLHTKVASLVSTSTKNPDYSFDMKMRLCVESSERTGWRQRANTIWVMFNFLTWMAIVVLCVCVCVHAKSDKNPTSKDSDEARNKKTNEEWVRFWMMFFVPDVCFACMHENLCVANLSIEMRIKLATAIRILKIHAFFANQTWKIFNIVILV